MSQIPGQIPISAPMEFTFTGLTEQDLQIINTALGELPAKLAIPVLNKMGKQIQDQQAAMARKSADVTPIKKLE